MNRIGRTSLTLASIAVLCATAVTATYRLTATRIDANQKAWLESRLAPALGEVAFDSPLTDDVLKLDVPHGLPGAEAALVYRVFLGSQPAAALFAVTAMNGYAGPIRILVGIDIGGTLTGVRILEHNETPGLGDKIERSRSDWVDQFPGRSLATTPLNEWAIRADGGRIDQLTGATVTPRAVVGAVRDTLLYFDANRDAIFAAGTEAQ